MVAAQTGVPSQKRRRLSGMFRLLRADRMELLLSAARERGDLGTLQVGPSRFVLLNTPELAHQVLVAQAEHFEKGSPLRRFGRPVFGNGLVTSLNAFHRRQRRLIAPAFQHRRVAAYADVMADYAERLQRSWRDGATIDVAHEMMRLTLWIAGKTLFDTDLLDDAAELGEAVTLAQRWFNRELARPVHIPLAWPTPRNRKMQRAVARLDATVYRLIGERRAGGEDRGDLLSMLLAARDADDGSFMTDRQVRDEALTLLMAGHETTANALAWTWYLLAQHPHVYARLRAEVDQVLGSRTPAAADLQNLPYSLQVLKESMRLYPPVPVVVREASCPVEIGGHAFPAGTRFIVSPYTVHRRPDLFADPERFDPDRFAPEAEARLPKGAYLPFASGPRNCIGNAFALMEGQIVLATLAQRVTFSLVPGQRIVREALITLRPRDGIRMRVKR